MKLTGAEMAYHKAEHSSDAADHHTAQQSLIEALSSIHNRTDWGRVLAAVIGGASPQDDGSFRNSMGSYQQGYSTLHRAIAEHRPEIVRALLALGASSNYLTANGHSHALAPLHEAVAQNDKDSIDILIDAGARPDLCDAYGMSPLMYAAMTGNVSAAKKLLDRGADIQARQDDGTTALHLATEKNQLEMMQFLLENGASPEDRNAKCKTAPDIARINQNKAAAELLQRYASQTLTKSR